MEKYVEHQVEDKVKKFVKGTAKVIGLIILFAIFILVFGYVFMRLWNWLMPELFGLTTIAFWQAIGLLVMAKLLFGGFEGKGGRGSGKKGSKRCRPKSFRSQKTDFSKWKHYERFWEDEGEKAYKDYVARIAAEKDIEE